MHGTRNRIQFIALCMALAGACTAAGGDGGGGEGEGDGSDPFGKGDYIARCDASSNPMLRCYGQTRFHSVAPVWDFLPMRALESAAANARGGGEVERTVEESDIFRHDAERNLLFVLNAYRGLQVLGVSDPDHPEFLGATSLGGYPVEMYQEGDFAFVLLNAFEAGSDQEPTDYGARVRVLDLSDPTSPVQVGDDFRLEGSITGSRLLPARDASGALVSQILYVASQAYTREPNQDAATWQPHSYIQSIDLTNPGMPAEVDKVEFRGTGHSMHVTTEAIFVASTDWSLERPTTNVQYVDIESLEGDIVLGGSLGVEGTLNWGESGELQLDHFRGHLRVASQISGRDAMGNW